MNNEFYIIPIEEDSSKMIDPEVMESNRKKWYDGMIKKNHIPIISEDGDLDIFVCDYDYHNGPGCSRCNENWCQHCDDVDKIEECDYLQIEEDKRIREEKKLDPEYAEYLRLKEKFFGVY